LTTPEHQRRGSWRRPQAEEWALPRCQFGPLVTIRRSRPKFHRSHRVLRLSRLPGDQPSLPVFQSDDWAGGPVFGESVNQGVMR